MRALTHEDAAELLERFAELDAAGLRKAHGRDTEDSSTKPTWRPPAKTREDR